MSDIASKLRKHSLELAWGAFTIANALVILLVQDVVTVPFHLIWISLSLLYGFKVWGVRATAAVVVGVCFVSVAVMVPAVVGSDHVHWDELLEIPLMATVFAAMVWHAQRRHEASEKTQRMAEKEREFVRDASHQFRTPITIARGHAELIRTAYEGEPAGADAGVILAELKRLSKMSDDLLLLAAAEHPNFLLRESVDLGQLIADTETRWSATAERDWLVVAVDDGSVLADRDRINLALDALIENAVKFTRTQDRIAILGGGEGDFAVLEVSDSGEGIAKEDLPRVFDRFARVHGQAQANGGTGLGLAIVKAIVEAHGGSISIESALGQGATFRVRLPGFRPDPRIALAGSAHGVRPASSRTTRV